MRWGWHWELWVLGTDIVSESEMCCLDPSRMCCQQGLRQPIDIDWDSQAVSLLWRLHWVLGQRIRGESEGDIVGRHGWGKPARQCWRKSWEALLPVAKSTSRPVYFLPSFSPLYLPIFSYFVFYRLEITSSIHRFELCISLNILLHTFPWQDDFHQSRILIQNSSGEKFGFCKLVLPVAFVSWLCSTSRASLAPLLCENLQHGGKSRLGGVPTLTCHFPANDQFNQHFLPE